MARNSRRYSAHEREHAVQLVAKLGLAEATNQLGYPKSTIAGWSYQSESQSAAPVTPAKGVQESAAEPVVAKSGKSVAKTYSPSLRAKALEYAAVHGVTKAAKEFGTTRFSIYGWQRKVKLHLEGKAVDSPITGSDEDQAAIRDQRILKEWRASAGLGPSQVRNQLRRQGFKVSVHTVRCVLEEHGYVTPKTRRESGHDQRYEAVRPHQMWHLDFLHRHIN